MPDFLATLDPKTLWGPLFGAFFGSLATAVLTWRRESRKARRDATRDFIEEFFSTAFLVHRAKIGAISWSIREKRITGEEVARGFIFPSEPEAYVGPEDDKTGLNEHQHLEVFLGYVRRLAHALDHGWVLPLSIHSGLSGSMQWHRELLEALVSGISVIAKSRGVPARTETVRAIETVLQATEPRRIW